MAYLKERLYEASTWRGVVYIIAACGIKMFPQFKDNIIIGALGAAGIISMFFKDSLKPVIPTIPASLEELKPLAQQSEQK